MKPHKNWKTGKYGGMSLSIGNGLIWAEVSWSMHREDHGYLVSINSRSYKKVFTDSEEAKLAAEKRIRELIAVAVEDLGEDVPK